MLGPGTDGTATLCSNGAPVQLINYLGGSPDPGGTWTFGGNPVSGTFTPGTSTPGVYTYTVPGPPVASANVTVIVHTLPNAGTNGTATACSNDAPFNLFSKLGGTPDGSGAWSFGGNPVGHTFTPGTSTPGVYSYTVNGPPPCPHAAATVPVTVNTLPNAGTNGTATVCSNDPPFNLFSKLGGTADGGGAW
ncbi:MAG: hypothetical protein J5I62_01575, partial [Flavobacteriales bacterium]|nr:hypothetical protein [Flavobacteriales bacterium]